MEEGVRRWKDGGGSVYRLEHGLKGTGRGGLESGIRINEVRVGLSPRLFA